MLKTMHLIPLTMLLSVYIGFQDFFLFRINPMMAFYIHNTLALMAGIVLLTISYYLSKKKSLNYLHIGGMIVGFVMIVAHITKIIMGVCI